MDYRGAMVEAYRVASIYATDPSTQNSALILNDAGEILSEGWNCFPTGFEETEARWERPGKYQYVEHAERNAVFCAARLGIPTAGATMVAPWAACFDCARAIVQAGVTTLVRHRECQAYGETHGITWNSLDGPDILLREAGIKIVDLHMHVGRKRLAIRHSGGVFVP